MCAEFKAHGPRCGSCECHFPSTSPGRPGPPNLHTPGQGQPWPCFGVCRPREETGPEAGTWVVTGPRQAHGRLEEGWPWGHVKGHIPSREGNSRAGVWVREEASEQHAQRLTGQGAEQLGLGRDSHQMGEASGRWCRWSGAEAKPRGQDSGGGGWDMVGRFLGRSPGCRWEMGEQGGWRRAHWEATCVRERWQSFSAPCVQCINSVNAFNAPYCYTRSRD